MRMFGECYNLKVFCLLLYKNVYCYVNKKLKNVYLFFFEGKNLKWFINLGYLGMEVFL